MLRHGQVEPAQVPHALEVVERNARAQAQLIEDLLDMSRIITGKLRVELRRLRSRPIVEAAIEAVAPGGAIAKRIDARASTTPRRPGRSAAMPDGCSRCSGTCCRTP